MDGVVYGYNMLLKTLIDFGRLNVLRFDESAANIFNQFQRQRLRVGTMDLRIAAIAMASEKTLVTRNTVDFERVPGLRFEDWTLPIK